MGKRILVLDDDQDILDVVSYLLTENGFDVQTLSSGDEILFAISRFDPDLVLMDVMLAGLDGRVICRNLKESEHTHHIPIILISGTHDLANSLNKRGAPNDFIAKPFDIDNLLNTIEKQFRLH